MAKKYEESQAIKDLAKKEAAYQKQADEAYSRLFTGSKYAPQLESIAQSIIDREPFEYDMSKDALYQNAKTQYTQLGKQAMADTVAKAAELTGGYGNSYGVTAGNQAYQGYLQQLNDMVPELYSIAQDRYNQQTQDMMSKYGLVSDLDTRYTQKYSDLLGAAQGMASLYEGMRGSRRAEEYGEFTDNRAYDYTVGRDAVTDAQWQKQYDLSKAAAYSGGSSSSQGLSVTDISKLNDMIGNRFDLGDDGRLASWDDNTELIELLNGLGLDHTSGVGAYLYDAYANEKKPTQSTFTSFLANALGLGAIGLLPKK